MAGPARRRWAWIDITMDFGHPAGTWPGDAELVVEWTSRIGGAGPFGVNLSRFCSSPHNGTHSDAPFHVKPEGTTSESLPVDAYLGPCLVVDATGVRGTVLPASLADEPTVLKAERVLLKTRRGPLGSVFPRDFKGLSPELAERLAGAGLRLVGTDAPSLDPYDSTGLRAHKALFAAGVAVVENLDLQRAPPGRYELVALPLKVRGLCAAPVRALLRPLPEMFDTPGSSNPAATTL